MRDKREHLSVCSEEQARHTHGMHRELWRTMRVFFRMVMKREVNGGTI